MELPAYYCYSGDYSTRRWRSWATSAFQQVAQWFSRDAQSPLLYGEWKEISTTLHAQSPTTISLSAYFFNYTSFFNVFNLLQLHVHQFVYLDNKYKHLNRCNDIYNQTNYYKVMKLKTSKLSDLPKINTRNWNKSEIVMALLWMTHISAGGLLWILSF